MAKEQTIQPERVMIFIDGSNFYHSVKETFNKIDNEVVDFSKLINFLRKGKLLISTYYYNAPLDRSYNDKIYGKQQKFFADLGRIPDFNVILCKLKRTKIKGKENKYEVKGDDIHLAVDMVSLAYEDQYDVAIIVSGDGDFVPAIKKVQKLGKKVLNAYFKVSSSSYLKQVCDFSTPLENIIENNCLKKKEK